MNHFYRKTLHSLLLACAAVTIAPGILAQTTPAPSTTLQADEILTLPEFSVGTSKLVGAYTAGDTVGASRMNAAVKDLPYSIESMTQQLMADFQIFDLNEDLSYMSAITGNSDAFTFSIRGYNSANVALFNGHYMFNPVVAPFVERTGIDQRSGRIALRPKRSRRHPSHHDTPADEYAAGFSQRVCGKFL